MSNVEVLIEARDLCKYYPVKAKKIFEKNKKVRAVEKLNLSIRKGSTFGLVGESGCGKSTTGQMLSEIVSATQGEILYQDKPLREMNRMERAAVRKKIQMVFQDPYSSLNPKRTIEWTLEEPLKSCTKLGKKERKQKVQEILKIVGLDESYGQRYPGELSGGQRQRVSIAAALILDPEFVIADESVSALDVSVQAQILNLLQKLQKEKGLTYLFISHDLNVVQYMSDEIGVMYLGHLVELGDAQEVCSHPAHPYTKALLSAIPEVEGVRKERIILEGEVPSPANVPEGCPFHTRCKEAQERCRKEYPAPRKVKEGHVVCCHNVAKV